MIKQLLKFVSFKVLIVVCLFLASLCIFAYIANEAVLGKQDRFDNMVSAYFSRHSSEDLIVVMRNLTMLGSTYFLLPAYLLLEAYLLGKKEFRKAIDIFVIASSSFLAMQGLKILFHRQRPDLPIIKGITSYSFPSGHALSSFIFCSITAYLVWSGKLHIVWKLLLMILLLIVAATIGLSRIILHVHYPTDVIAGFCLGVMWVILSVGILRKVKLNVR